MAKASIILPSNATGGDLNITALSTAPTAPEENAIYLDDGTNTANSIVGLRRYSGAAWVDLNQGILNKYDATTAPTANEDSGDGYSVGSIWVDVTNDNAYILADATVASAVWLQISGSVLTEIYLSGAGGISPTTNGAESVTTEYGSNAIAMQTLDFDQATDEYAQWTFQLPSNYNGGTVTATFIWTAASGSGDVVWGCQGISVANDEAIDQAWGTAQTVTDTLLATGDQHTTSATSAITLAGTPAADELAIIRVYRDADAGGDTLTADAKLIGVRLNYTAS